MKFQEVKKYYPMTVREDWKQRNKGWVHESAHVEASALIGENCIIGPDAAVRENAVLHPCCVLLEESWVGREALLHPKVMLRRKARVRARTCIGSNSTLEEYSCVGNDAELDSEVLVQDHAYVEPGVRIGYRGLVRAGNGPVSLTNVAEWGPISAHEVRDGGWRILCGCRYLTYEEAVRHWSTENDQYGERAYTRMAVEFLRELAVKRGWEKPVAKKGTRRK